jgi:hypothetical protein
VAARGTAGEEEPDDEEMDPISADGKSLEIHPHRAG